MNTELKNILIQSFYQKVLKKNYQPNWIEVFPQLNHALDHMYQLDNDVDTNGFLDLDNPDRDEAKSRVVISMLKYFHQNYQADDDLRFLDEAYEQESFYHNSTLPDSLYSERAVRPDDCGGLARYQQTTLAKIEEFIRQNPSGDDADKLREDYKKIQNLSKVLVPNDSGGMNGYYTLAESAGGVTEKVSLVSRTDTLLRLKALIETDMTRQEYLTNRNDYKLSTQAILKLPKHGDIKEVQRELIALNISQILGFRTTSRTMVEYKGRPALHVPFEKIELISDFVHGQTKVARLGSFGKKYFHYSTIKPVGEGLCAEQIIDDPGLSLSFYYLCSDTDAFGGYNQNKALYGAKEWYMFDQVVMAEDKLGLDSRLSMQPTQTLMKHTRHGQGRNRTLVEDSSFENKFSSLFHLQNKRIEINAMMDKMINQHQQVIDVLKVKGKLNKDDIQRLKDLITLQKDAKTIKTVMENRIRAALLTLPYVNNKSEVQYESGDIGKIQMHGLMFEKLLNKPVLFTDDGRPYRQPWTYRPKQQLSNISLLGDGENVQLDFSKNLDVDSVRWISRAVDDRSMKMPNSKTLIMSVETLHEINDRMLFPEHKIGYDSRHDYLNLTDLSQLASHYSGSKQNRLMLNLMHSFKNKFDPSKQLNVNMMYLVTVIDRFKLYKTSYKEIGFICHVEKCFHYDMQQRLQSLMHTVPINMYEAFQAAIKLDRLVEFNQVCLEAVKNNKVMNPSFNIFLAECIQLGQAADNYHQSKASSTVLREHAQECIQGLQSQQDLALGAFHGSFFAHNHSSLKLEGPDKPSNDFSNS